MEEAARQQGGDSAVEKLKEAEKEVAKAVEAIEEKMVQPEADPAVEPTYGKKGVVHASNVVSGSSPELIGGVLPKDMVLPAAIGFLGVVILGVFIASRGGKK